MATGKDRVGLEAANVPVSISDAGVSPGNVMMYDDGSVVVPMVSAQEVLEAAQETDAVQRQMFEFIEQGITGGEARSRIEYSRLQTCRD